MVATVLALVPAAAAQAATFTVTKTADTNGTCAPGNCSLREAVKAADAADGNTVSIPAGTFRLTTGDGGSGELRIAHDMTITGAGARSTTVDANGKSRAFAVASSTASVTFNDLRITGGMTPAASPLSETFPAGHGGGIFSTGAVTLNRVSLDGNTARDGGGGFENSSAKGASLNSLDVNITASTIANNSVKGGTGNSQGGGLAVFGNLTMTNTTVAGNSVSGTGANEGAGVTATSGSFDPDAGTLIFTNVTIAGNQITGGTPATNLGGGLAGDSNAFPFPILYSSLRARNTIIGGNLVNGARQDCAAANTTISDHNISSDSTCGFTDQSSRQGTDPGLLTLENRGGPTDTMGLSPTSAATNNGTNTGCPGTDQRGVVRPQAGTCDVGAVELALPTATTGDATGRTSSRATIHGIAGNPHVDPGTVFFQYGTTLNYGATTPAEPLAPGASAASFAATLSRLRPGVYHYRIGSTNRDGTAFGKDRAFRIVRVRAPRIRLLGVPRACASRAFRIRIRATVARRSKLRSIRVRLDGRVIKRSKRKTTTVLIDASRLRSGRHTISVRATDRGGRSKVVRRTFSRCRRPRRIAPQFTG